MAEQTEGTPAETGGAAEGAPSEGGEDRFDQLSQSFERFQQDVTSRLDRLGQPDEEPDEEPDELDGLEFQFREDDFEEGGGLSNEAQLREIARMARAIAREEVGTVQAERADERRMTEADALEQRYPQLQDEEYQDKIVEMTRRQAAAFGQPELAREPHFLEMVHLAEQARQGAAAETPAGSTQGATLERGGGAPPAEQSSTEEEGDRIVKAARAGKFRLGD